MDEKQSRAAMSNVSLAPVQAYAKLQGDSFKFYMDTLQIMIGRGNGVDVDLPSRSVSRRHARIFFDFEQGRG